LFNITKTYENVTKEINDATFTSAVRAFGPDYFRDSASVLKPRHIGAKPKGTSFGLG